MTSDLLLARGLAAMSALCLVGVGVSPFFYGWHVVAAWVLLTSVLAVLSAVENRAAQKHRRKMRQASLPSDRWHFVGSRDEPQFQNGWTIDA